MLETTRKHFPLLLLLLTVVTIAIPAELKNVSRIAEILLQMFHEVAICPSIGVKGPIVHERLLAEYGPQQVNEL